MENISISMHACQGSSGHCVGSICLGISGSDSESLQRHENFLTFSSKLPNWTQLCFYARDDELYEKITLGPKKSSHAMQSIF